MAKYPFKNLVFQGGGVKTFAYHGALRVLEAHGILAQIERVAGTSAGATLATVLSFRLPAEETIRLLQSVDYAKIPLRSRFRPPQWARRTPWALEKRLDKLLGRVDSLNRMVRRYGWYANDYVHNWLCKVIAEQCAGNGRATFEDFRSLGYRDLYIVAANLSTHQVTVFCADSTPDVAVADAVVMSGTLPLFFEAVQFDGTRFGSGDFYADGGLVANYPIHIFDQPQFEADSRHFLHGINWETLGCRLYTPADCAPQNHAITGLLSYVQNMFATLAHAQAVAFENSLVDKMRTINISDCCVNTTDFRIRPREDDPKYTALVQAGENAAREYLQNYKLPTDRFYDVKAKFAEFLAQWR